MMESVHANVERVDPVKATEVDRADTDAAVCCTSI
jgi:hypothetical protein